MISVTFSQILKPINCYKVTKVGEMRNKKQERPKTPIEIMLRQDEALRRVRSLKKRSISIRRKRERNAIIEVSCEKRPRIGISNQYSIEKVNEDHDIEFMSQNLKSKDLQRKNWAKAKLQKYIFEKVIGFGIFGKVWKSKDRFSQKIYAIKEVNKSLVLSKNGIATTMNERHLLPKLNFHLIPGLVSAFQDDLNLYLVLPLLEKGDLRYHLTKFHHFEEQVVRFFAGCLVSILEYLRSQGIIHRDIKPENLLLDQMGYLHLIDFGISQRVENAQGSNCCGTPAYMAPEVMFGKDYGFESDYYGLGVFLFEMMMGQRPYRGSKRDELKEKIVKGSAHLKKNKIPEGWSVQAIDFINRLLHRNPATRLGFAGIQQLKQHPWLRYFPWRQLLSRQLVSPYQQSFKHWQVNYKQMAQLTPTRELQETEQALKRGEMQQLFQMFTYEGFQKSMEWTTKPSTQFRQLFP